MNFDLLILALLFGQAGDNAKRDGRAALQVGFAVMSVAFSIGFAVTEIFR